MRKITTNGILYYKFILECFSRPRTVSNFTINDPQLKKILSVLGNKGKDEINLLDYGAGECRLGKCLKYFQEEETTYKNIHYYAFEPYPKKEQSKDANLYTNIADIPTDLRFDVIVLMNVLHEIDVLEWEGTFDVIFSLLKDKGIVILVEVITLTNGEMPFGETGYLVLQDDQVKKLFQSSIELNIKKGDEKSNCWLLDKSDLEKVNGTSIIASVSNLMKSTDKMLQMLNTERIIHLDKMDEKARMISARKYAFLTQQYINARFAVELLNGGKTQDKNKNI